MPLRYIYSNRYTLFNYQNRQDERERKKYVKPFCNPLQRYHVFIQPPIYLVMMSFKIQNKIEATFTCFFDSRYPQLKWNKKTNSIDAKRMQVYNRLNSTKTKQIDAKKIKRKKTMDWLSALIGWSSPLLKSLEDSCRRPRAIYYQALCPRCWSKYSC